MNKDGVITLGNLGNELEKPLFVQKSEGNGSFLTEMTVPPVKAG